MQFSGVIGDLGIDLGPIAPIAGTVAKSLFSGPGGGSGGGGLPATNINPAFQQAFTPQFAPTMQQQQDSPGAIQTATPLQYATGGQTAGEGASTIPSGPALPPDFFGPSFAPTFQDKSNYQTLISTGILAVAGIMIANILSNKKGKGNNFGKKKRQNYQPPRRTIKSLI